MSYLLSTLVAATALQPLARRALVAGGGVRCGSVVARTAGRRAILQVPTVAAAHALGARLASVSCAGDVIMLEGTYGAGKTCLARGFIRGWYGDDAEQVTSPSYLIDNVYDDDGRARLAGVAVHHMDLWRLEKGKVAELVDLPRVFTECVSLIEWPEKLGAVLEPVEQLRVHLALRDEAPGAAPTSEVERAKRSEAEGPAATGEEEEEEAADQPRVATLTALGPQWEERLHVLRLPLDRPLPVYVRGYLRQ
jgi:tRNA threonylcarbamoyl adenosine modification protein YjeE